MKRSLLALTLFVALIVFIPAQIVARQRPVALASWPAKPGVEAPHLRASARWISDGNRVLDLKTRTQRVAPVSLVGGDWTFDWGSGGAQPGQIILNHGTKAVAFPVPANVNKSGNWWIVRVSPARDCLEASWREDDPNALPNTRLDGFMRWSLSSRRVQQVVFPSHVVGDAVLTRDGQTLVSVEGEPASVVLISTRTGKPVSQQPVRGLKFPPDAPLTRTQMSSFGAYFVRAQMPQGIFTGGGIGRKYTEPPARGNFEWQVVSTRTARAVWSYHLLQRAARAVFSPDEKSLAVPNEQTQRWEIRALATGKLIRTLPLLPGTQTGAFSPDAGALYSVSGGKLYRQRAR